VAAARATPMCRNVTIRAIQTGFMENLGVMGAIYRRL
jgi:hypothetical protein